MRQTIIVLDFGSQYSQLIVRRVREQKVYCEIHSYNLPSKGIKKRNPSGIILSGGPASVYIAGAPLPDPGIFQLGIPVLGICYGMQVMAHQLGGQVAPAGEREYGYADLMIDPISPLFAGLRTSFPVWMSHGDRISRLPVGFQVVARTANSPVAVMEDCKRKFYGVQFHPEVIHTLRGKEIIANFLFSICGCTPNWTMKSFIHDSVKKIKEKTGEGRAICALSGGVDSSTAAVLVHRAIGDRLTCIFVNNGLLRKGEPEQVLQTFREHFHIPLQYVNAQERFLRCLQGVEEPEEKRRRVGEEFIRIFEEEARKLGKIEFLVQGTLYPDVIESTSTRGPSSTIKTHHNVGGLPPDLKFRLIEPLRELFKDEVRELARELGIPEITWERHPFPGPGLAVRILGEVTPERLVILREADAIVEEEVKKAGFYSQLWQAFAVLLPIKTVGVMGDERTYERVIALRAVTSSDAMTADWAHLPYDLLGRISNRIINEVKGINRVVYDISSKPPSTIEWE